MLFYGKLVEEMTGDYFKYEETEEETLIYKPAAGRTADSACL